MRKKQFVNIHKASIFFLVWLACTIILAGCAHQKSQLSVSQYRFNLEDRIYRIRSISAEDKAESYNELIGEKFLAIDFDQDRIIDCILLGDGSLKEAQKIYEYGLNEVTKENKLEVRNPSIHRYLHNKNDLQLEIISFRPSNAQPFNEFKITDNRPLVRPGIIIVVDHNADGSLDEVVKGTVTLEKIQTQYDEAIAAGLKNGDLVKANGTILVKEK